MGVITRSTSPTLVQHIQRGWSFFNEEMNRVCRSAASTTKRMKGKTGIAAPQIRSPKTSTLSAVIKAEYVVIGGRRHTTKQDYSRMLIDPTSKKGARCIAVCAVPIEEAPHLALWRLMRTIKLSNSLKNLLTYRQCRTIRANLWRYGIYVFDADYL